MATETTVKQILLMLMADYPERVNQLTADQLRSLRMLYVQALADIDDELLKAAALRHVSESPWFPKVSELRKAAAAVALPPALDPLEAWGLVVKEIRRTGSYGRPQFDDPLTAAVVQQLGWRELCLSETMAADRARFVDAYERQVGRARAQMTLPVGLQDGSMSDRLLEDGSAGVIRQIAEARRV